MHIERTQGFDALGLPDPAKNLPKADQTSAAARRAGEPAGASAGAGFEPYILRAADAPAVRSEAVQEARRLLASGELDTPEAVQRAAEAILRLGI